MELPVKQTCSVKLVVGTGSHIEPLHDFVVFVHLGELVFEAFVYVVDQKRLRSLSDVPYLGLQELSADYSVFACKDCLAYEAQVISEHILLTLEGVFVFSLVLRARQRNSKIHQSCALVGADKKQMFL